jgi:hypothetical protein
VVAGPAEGAALGNVLVQARALGAAPSGLDGLRALLRSSVRLRRFAPPVTAATGLPPRGELALANGAMGEACYVQWRIRSRTQAMSARLQYAVTSSALGG